MPPPHIEGVRHSLLASDGSTITYDMFEPAPAAKSAVRDEVFVVLPGDYCVYIIMLHNCTVPLNHTVCIIMVRSN